MVYFWAINKNLRCPVLARVDLVSFAPVNLLQFNKCFPKNKLGCKMIDFTTNLKPHRFIVCK